jgi:hypothetical protein
MPTREREKLSVRRLALAVLIPLALTALVYGRAGSFDFVELDDPYYVYTNADLAQDHGTAIIRYAFTSHVGANWNPLVWLSFFADRALWHLRPGPMHVENVVLHGCCGVLVLLLLADATGRLGRAAVCGAVFAVHPMHVESVAWISERKDVLSTVWLLAAMCCYVRYCRTGGRRGVWFAAVLACYALSLCAKSMGVTLPAVLLLLDVWPLRRMQPGPNLAGNRSQDPAITPRRRMMRLLLEKIPLLLMAAASAAAAVYTQRITGATSALSTTVGDRLGNAAVSVVRYGIDLFCPTGLAVFYPFRPQPITAVIVSVMLLLGVTFVCVRFRRRFPYLIVGWLWFCGTLLPVCGIVQLGMQAMADRYVYFPSIGVSVAVVWWIAEVTPRFTAAKTGLAVAVVCALAVAARLQAGYWKDNVALFGHAAAVTDGNYMALDELGWAAARRGDMTTAVADLQASADARDDYWPAYDDLGQCALMTGHPAEAVKLFTRAVQLAPSIPTCRQHLAEAVKRTVQQPPGARNMPP